MTALETQVLLARAVLLILLYSFIGAVGILAWLDLGRARRAATASPSARGGTRLIVLDGGECDRPPGTAFPLEPVTALGRDLDNDVVLAELTLSGRHAVISQREGLWWIEDLASTNGSFVNGVRVPPEVPAVLRSGDVIQLGAVRLRLVTAEP